MKAADVRGLAITVLMAASVGLFLWGLRGLFQHEPEGDVALCRDPHDWSAFVPVSDDAGAHIMFDPYRPGHTVALVRCGSRTPHGEWHVNGLVPGAPPPFMLRADGGM